MSDRGYWARLGLEGIEEGRDDHPLGIHYGTIESSVLPRLAVLRKELTTPSQMEAFEALWTELGRYCQQMNGVVEDLREMARDLKDLEDQVTYEAPDLQQLRDIRREYPDYQRFDPEAYKRSSVVNKDLSEVRFRVDWEREAHIGRSLDDRLSEATALKQQELAERRSARIQEEKAKREAEMLERLGVLYKTSPQGIDESIPRNVRADMAAAERRLAALGFTIQADGHVHCCTKPWGDFIVYADPRSGSSLRFNVYKGPEDVYRFWLKDKLGNLEEKFEAQLSQLQEKARTSV